jgi:hypothetical protein
MGKIPSLKAHNKFMAKAQCRFMAETITKSTSIVWIKDSKLTGDSISPINPSSARAANRSSYKTKKAFSE